MDLMAGNVDLFLCTFNACGGRLHDGTMTPLVVTTLRRYSEAPEVPTLAEAGFPGTEMTSWYFIAAPRGTPAPVVQKLSAALNDVLADEALRKRAAAIGIELETKSSPTALQSLVQTEIERWRAAAASGDGASK